MDRPESGSVIAPDDLAHLGQEPQDVGFDDPTHTAHEVYASAAGGREVPTLGDLGLVHPRELGKPVWQLSVLQRHRRWTGSEVSLGDRR